MAHLQQGGWRARAAAGGRRRGGGRRWPPGGRGAEADLDAGHVRAARKHARQATCLDPDSPRASLLLTAVSILVADHSSHRATLLAIASGVGLDECGGEQGGVNGARDDGPRGRRTVKRRQRWEDGGGGGDDDDVGGRSTMDNSSRTARAARRHGQALGDTTGERRGRRGDAAGVVDCDPDTAACSRITAAVAASSPAALSPVAPLVADLFERSPEE
uniref:Uncharacterized protein n=1 Tax=Oryza sativa subsp. japonica TaxID=39947 RepID=Q6EPE1_ORYSJ|nr:hypothetical protein [Oryza sativa Japonica Group]